MLKPYIDKKLTINQLIITNFINDEVNILNYKKIMLLVTVEIYSLLILPKCNYCTTLPH